MDRPPAGEAARLRAGADLVLHADAATAASLPSGVLLDDLLDPEARAAIDATARAALERWRATNAPRLTVSGVELAHVHEVELFIDVFLRELRVVEGLRRAFAGGAPERLAFEGIDSALAECLRATLAPQGVELDVRRPGGPPTYPIGFGLATGARRLTGAVREIVGLPGWPRGRVLIQHSHHLTPLWRRLAQDRDTRPVLELIHSYALPGPDRRALARAGGWVGHAGARGRRRSRGLTRRVIDKARPAPGDPLDAFLHGRAVALLDQRALDTVAHTDVYRRVFTSGPVRSAVVPSDTAPTARMIGVAAREAGAPVTYVQHGVIAAPVPDGGTPPPYSDGLVADRVAVWSDANVARLTGVARGRVSRTGNPGAGSYAATPTPRPGAKATLVLIQSPTQTSIAMDNRVSADHVDQALAALSASRPGVPVILRPHPMDGARALYERMAEGAPTSVAIDSTTSLSRLLAEVDLCVGAVSTASFEAVAGGVPVVLLLARETPLPWPFAGPGTLPTARSAAELADLIPAALSAGAAEHRALALDALGAVPGALENVHALVAGSGAGTTAS